MHENKKMERDAVGSILILYEEKMTYLGDTCIRTSRIRFLKAYFKNAAIDLNVTDQANLKYCDGLLTHNPYIRSISNLSWDNIDFNNYDVLFLAAYDESRFRDYLAGRYPDLSPGDGPMLISFSRLLLRPLPVENTNYVLTEHTELNEFLSGPQTGEIYITGEERTWADQWLAARGLEKDELLFIIIDSSSRRDKMIRINVFHELLTFLLTHHKCKVLIFNERQIGKTDFYRSFLGDAFFQKIIFSEHLSLREDLRLLGSSYTKLIFGPCTGLMHCASSIYNYYVSSGMNAGEVPLIVTYTGRYTANELNANTWWGNSPLVSCLILKERSGKKELLVLHDLSKDQRDINDPLPCSEYGSKILIDLIQTRGIIKWGQLLPN